MIYLGYYDTQENISENRSYVLAASNKMDYIAKSLVNIGESVNIISASETRNYGKLYHGRKQKISENITLKLLPSMLSSFRPLRLMLRILFKVQLLLYLLFTIRRNETIIVYHSLEYMNIVRLIKRLKNVVLILEVEEIYGDVSANKRIKAKELSLFRLADSFIFATEKLNHIANPTNKPNVTIYGVYDTAPTKNVNKDDGKVHVVYAGTFDPRKGGAATSIDVAKVLDGSFHIHILGFGNKKEVEAVKNQIAETVKVTEATITYDGLLKGDDYINFIQSCNIGLSTQNPNAKFNNTSFPSKILSYLSNGLKVVTIKIPVVSESALSSELFFYTEATPIAVAQAIIEAARTPKNADISHQLLNKLDHKFKAELQELLKGRSKISLQYNHEQ